MKLIAHHKKIYELSVHVALLLLFISTSVLAQDKLLENAEENTQSSSQVKTPEKVLGSLKERFAFNTYGSIGFSKSNVKAPFYRSKNTSTFGIDDHWSGVMDNRLGFQMTANFDPNWSAVVHSVVERNGDDKLNPSTIWAQLKWKYSDQTHLYLGRSLNTLFLTSEEFYVGYAHPWVRPPVELYSMGGENGFSDGVNVQHQMPIGNAVLSLEAKVGVSSLDRMNYSVQNRPIYAVSASLIQPELTLRASLVQANVSAQIVKLDPLLSLIRQQSPEIAQEYSLENVKGQGYISLGMRYEYQHWFLMMEMARTHLRRKSLPDQLGGYATLGYTMGNWMPYLSYSQQKILGSTDETRLTGLASHAANAYLSAKKNDQKNLSLGLRWDVKPGISLKFQLDQVKPQANEMGLLSAKLPTGHNQIRVFSLMMDWAY
jgi:hypothetical protein